MPFSFLKPMFGLQAIFICTYHPGRTPNRCNLYISCCNRKLKHAFYFFSFQVPIRSLSVVSRHSLVPQEYCLLEDYKSSSTSSQVSLVSKGLCGTCTCYPCCECRRILVLCMERTVFRFIGCCAAGYCLCLSNQ